MGAIFGYHGPALDRQLDRMGELLRHRGRGRPQLNATVGHVPQFEAEHPLKRGSGLLCRSGVTVAVAGYLDRELGSLLDDYLEHGEEALDTLQGAFALVLKHGDTVHLMRDGSGVRTLYYAVCEGRLLFATEPKAILSHPDVPRRLRPASVAQYFTFSFVPGRHTMLEDLFEVEAGHRVTWTPGSQPLARRYFHFEHTADAEAGGDWVERFRDLHGRIVAERLPPDGEPVGVFLSGGIDSSVVAAEVARRHEGPVRTYTIHFGKNYPHELDFARMVAERSGTEHREVLIQPKDFLSRFRKCLWHLDDPIGDPITVPNFEVARVASEEVRWVFNGEGGDPCFGGPKNIPMMLHHWYGGIPREGRFRERMYLASYRRAYEELDWLLSPELRAQIDPERDLEGVLTPFFEASHPERLLDKLMAINIRLKGAHLILPKVDRMMGAWGLTPFAPLFDARLVRLSFAMPPTLKLKGGVEKFVIKEAYKDLVPDPVIRRPKSGMRVPVHYWFQKEMRRYARSILSPRAVRQVGLFDPARVQQLLNYDTEQASGRYGIRLWMLLSFEVWRRLVIDREPV